MEYSDLTSILENVSSGSFDFYLQKQASEEDEEDDRYTQQLACLFVAFD